MYRGIHLSYLSLYYQNIPKIQTCIYYCKGSVDKVMVSFEINTNILLQKYEHFNKSRYLHFIYYEVMPNIYLDASTLSSVIFDGDEHHLHVVTNSLTLDFTRNNHDITFPKNKGEGLDMRESIRR